MPPARQRQRPIRLQLEIDVGGSRVGKNTVPLYAGLDRKLTRILRVRFRQHRLVGVEVGNHLRGFAGRNRPAGSGG